MSIKLEDYEEFLEQVPAVRDVLQSTFKDAAHIMSPTGLQTIWMVPNHCAVLVGAVI